VSHSFKKVNSPRGEVIRGCFVPLPAETYMHSIDANIIPQFVHKMGNHFQLINLLIGNLRQGNIATPELDNLQQALDETVEFTREFLNYAQVPSCRSEFELGEVLNTAIESMLSAFVEKRITLRNLVDDFAGVSVLGDPLLLEVALKSILQNANDATKSEDEVTVRAIHERHPRSGRAAARIIITDTGCGMDEHMLTQAVTPFFTSHHNRGGLGLSFAARIIELHGGSLRLSSTERQGAQVEIMLPASIGNQKSARGEY